MATITVKRSFEFRKTEGNAKTRYKARRAEKQAKERGDKALARKIDVALSGCGEKVLKAISVARDTPVYDDMDNCCLPQVALFNAGHRKSENVTAR